jgi:hypothetical protein
MIKSSIKLQYILLYFTLGWIYTIPNPLHKNPEDGDLFEGDIAGFDVLLIFLFNKNNNFKSLNFKKKLCSRLNVEPLKFLQVEG